MCTMLRLISAIALSNVTMSISVYKEALTQSLNTRATNSAQTNPAFLDCQLKQTGQDAITQIRYANGTTYLLHVNHRLHGAVTRVVHLGPAAIQLIQSLHVLIDFPPAWHGIVTLAVLFRVPTCKTTSEKHWYTMHVYTIAKATVEVWWCIWGFMFAFIDAN